MGRLSDELRDRAERFSDRMLDVVLTLEDKRVYARVIDQMVGCGTSVGANACEADQAVSAPDFCRALGKVVKELAECGYWLRTCVRRFWLRSPQTSRLEADAVEMAKIFSSMIARSRRRTTRKKEGERIADS